MNKVITNQEDLKLKIKDGMEQLSSIVGKTLGPGGLPILLERIGLDASHLPLGPLVTKDGVTVAKNIKVAENVLNTILRAIIEVAEKTNIEAGDGPQDLNSLILTPTGWVKMGSVKVGMKICGTNGTMQKILGVFPKGKKEIYEVEFENGGVVKCCKDHSWFVTDHKKVKRLLTTKKMIKDYVSIRKSGDKKYKYYTPKTYVEFNQNISKMPIDSYLLGVLISDGIFRNSGSIELFLGLQKEYIIEKLKLFEGISLKVKYIENKNYFSVNLSNKDKNGKGLRENLKSLGVYDSTSCSKLIPKSYLYSSKSIRESLLWGLIDTGGHVDNRGRFEYSTMSSRLAKDFVELARGIGKTVHLRRDKSSAGIFIYRIQELKGYKYGNKIIRITPTNKHTEMQCIKVSNPDNLYITDNYIVTHNTTTAVVLANSLYKEGLKLMAVGKRPEQIYKAISKTTDTILSALDKMAEKVDSVETIRNIATISANGEEEVGDIVSKAFDAVGEQGVITLEEGYDKNTVLKLESGFQIDRGLIRPEVFYTNMGSGECVLNNCALIIYDGDINSEQDLIPIMEKITNKWKSKDAFLIIARDIVGSCLNTLIVNRMEERITNFAMIKGPHVGQVRTQMMQDIAIATGAKMLIPDASGQCDNLKKAEVENLGFAKKIVLTKYRTLIYGGNGDDAEIVKRVDELEQLKSKAESPYDAQILEGRMASLSGGIAVIQVGGRTELEMKEKRDRIEDALNATRAAIQEGVVPGGGSVLFYLSTQMNDEKDIGEIIMKEVLQSPIKQIITNIGETPDVILAEIKRKVSGLKDINEISAIGYDGRNKKICNLIKNKIIDPIKVIKVALKNAVSISNLLLTCGGSVTIDQDKFSNVDSGDVK